MRLLCSTVMVAIGIAIMACAFHTPIYITSILPCVFGRTMQPNCVHALAVQNWRGVWHRTTM